MRFGDVYFLTIWNNSNSSSSRSSISRNLDSRGTTSFDESPIESTAGPKSCSPLLVKVVAVIESTAGPESCSPLLLEQWRIFFVVLSLLLLCTQCTVYTSTTFFNAMSSNATTGGAVYTVLLPVLSHYY